MLEKYDYIIVGGGAAGCCLANRLSASPSHKVLLIEAGMKDSWWHFFVHMPAAITKVVGNPLYDWRFRTQPEPFLNNRSLLQPRGKVLGGSSGINAMVFQRGNPLDYEKWASDPGMEHWAYRFCLPYFKKLETSTTIQSEFRGSEGPISVHSESPKNQIAQSFIEAAKQAGHHISDDLNGFRQEGFGIFDSNVKNGTRHSTSQAYLHPIMGRDNLDILSSTLVTKILFEGKRATGVEVKKTFGSKRYFGNEVILAAGAIQSPYLLKHSGVGAVEELEKFNIPVVEDLPSVGENLQDHLFLHVFHRSKKPASLYPWLQWYRQPQLLANWLFHRKGAGASSHLEVGGFARSNQGAEYPDIEYTFCPVAVDTWGKPFIKDHSFTVHFGPRQLTSQGSIKLKSGRFKDSPAIQFNYLSNDKEKKQWIDALAIIRAILNQPAMKEYTDGELYPGKNVQSDQEIINWVQREAETSYHPTSSCKMGLGKDSVVDPKNFKVHGLEGLRVIDASVMPNVTNANTLAPTVMIAERGADAILGNSPLPPEDITFYSNTTL